MRQGMETFLRAFPDIRSRVDFMVADGDLVVGHHTTTGTQAEEFLGIPATGKSFRVDEIHIVRIVDGKAVEHWGLADDLNMLQQLGVLEQKA
jgi:predicted ester cyclase